MADIPKLYNQSYGQRFQIDTWCSDVATASGVVFHWRKVGASTTYRITGSVVAVADLDKLEKRTVQCTLPAGWLKNKLGLWCVQAEIQWTTPASVYSDEVLVEVARTPSITTTTTSTSSTSSTSTTAA